MKPVFTTDAARADVERLMIWYEELQDGLADRLLDDILRSIFRIGNHPRSDSFLPNHRLRRRLTSTFPFAIYYREEDDRIMVVAILHQRMDVEAQLKGRGLN
jgi:plasmid stabilization system protein ParE